MTQGLSDRPWQSDIRTSETKQFIRDIKRITRRKFTTDAIISFRSPPAYIMARGCGFGSGGLQYT